MKLDDHTTVPLYWLITALVFSCGCAWVTSAAWFSVSNDIHELKADVKLLKHKAGIQDAADSPEEESTASGIQNAYGAIHAYSK